MSAIRHTVWGLLVLPLLFGGCGGDGADDGDKPRPPAGGGVTLRLKVAAGGVRPALGLVRGAARTGQRRGPHGGHRRQRRAGRGRRCLCGRSLYGSFPGRRLQPREAGLRAAARAVPGFVRQPAGRRMPDVRHGPDHGRCGRGDALAAVRRRADSVSGRCAHRFGPRRGDRSGGAVSGLFPFDPATPGDCPERRFREPVVGGARLCRDGRRGSARGFRHGVLRGGSRRRLRLGPLRPRHRLRPPFGDLGHSRSVCRRGGRGDGPCTAELRSRPRPALRRAFRQLRLGVRLRRGNGRLRHRGRQFRAVARHIGGGPRRPMSPRGPGRPAARFSRPRTTTPRLPRARRSPCAATTCATAGSTTGSGSSTPRNTAAVCAAATSAATATGASS